jgi:hypothetical protein
MCVMSTVRVNNLIKGKIETYMHVIYGSTLWQNMII